MEIIDNGPGIPPQNLTPIFEPFFTMKSVSLGKGLGLTISRSIVGNRHGGEFEVESRRPPPTPCVSEIGDNGGGIPPEAQQHIFFLPFFTTKAASGTGLGLVSSHRIVVERHHGKIDCETGLDGTRFKVRLPFETSEHW